MLQTYLFLIVGPDDDIIYTRQDSNVKIANPLLTSLFESMTALQTVIFDDQFKGQDHGVQHVSMQGGEITINVSKKQHQKLSFYLVYSGRKRKANRILELTIQKLREEGYLIQFNKFKFSLPTQLKNKIDRIVDLQLLSNTYPIPDDGSEVSLEV